MKAKFFLCGAWMVLSAISVFATPERWKAPGGEFTFEFTNHPESGRQEGAASEGGNHLDYATCSLKAGVERVEITDYTRDGIVAKKEAIERGEYWAKVCGISNISFSFDDSSIEDVKLTIKGSRVLANVPSTFWAVMHFGRRTFALQWVAEVATEFPSPDASRFIASIHQASVAPAIQRP